MMEMLKDKPNFADIHNNRGSILKNLKKYNEALASYEKALQLNPDRNILIITKVML